MLKKCVLLMPILARQVQKGHECKTACIKHCSVRQLPTAIITHLYVHVAGYGLMLKRAR